MLFLIATIIYLNEKNKKQEMEIRMKNREINLRNQEIKILKEQRRELNRYIIINDLKNNDNLKY